jgi:glutathionylspermidine synthase
MQVVTQPWSCRAPLPPADFADLMRRAIFACCKWHTQVEDRPVLCPYPLVVPAVVWKHLSGQALALAREALAAEQELPDRPELHAELGLPSALCAALRRVRREGPTRGPRVIRFDFHWTDDGWRISEANADVAGGFIESSGVTALMARYHPDLEVAGDPAGVLAEVVEVRLPVALLHLTGYTEDRQIALYLGRRLHERGRTAFPCAPDQVRWERGQAWLTCPGYSGPAGLVFRFFPAEWLPSLPRRTNWTGFFSGGRTPVCNPGSAVLSASKRFPLIWDRLTTSLSAWRSLLPTTLAPDRDTLSDPDDWVIKPALGHEGNDIGLAGVTDADDWDAIRASAVRHPDAWVIQRRFRPVPLETPEGPQYPCLGIYVIEGRIAGAYGRIADRSLTDDRARDIVVLIEGNHAG